MKKTEMQEKTALKLDNVTYCKKILLDEKFAEKEIKFAALRGGDTFEQLHSRIMDGVKKTSTDYMLCNENLVSLIAWDIIISTLTPNEQIPNNPSQLNKDDSPMWYGVFKGWFDDVKPKDEKSFQEWFICMLQVANVKKINLKLDVMFE